MTYVRRFTPADEAEAVALAKAMHGEAPNYRAQPFDEAKVRSLIHAARASDDWLALVARSGNDNALVGFALMTVQETFFGPTRELLDLSIYVAPGRRGSIAFYRLMRVAEEWGRDSGAEYSRIGITTGVDHDRALGAFIKLGYRPSGLTVTRRF